MRTVITLIASLPLLASAQGDYFANNPIWRVTSVCNQAGMGGGPCIITDDHQYMLSGDTLINGTTYKRTLREGSISPMWMGPGPAPSNCTINYGYGPEISIPVRQEGRAMYVWNDNEDQLLFDFDMQVGEMLPLSFNNADPNIEVVDLDSIQLDGEWRRVFSISGGLAVTIVEGIGSGKGFFEAVSGIFEGGHNLTGFSLNGGAGDPG